MSREHDVVTLSGAEYDALLSEAEEAKRLREELAALRAAPADPAMWRWRGPKGGWIADERKPSAWDAEPLYTAPPAPVAVKPLEWHASTWRDNSWLAPHGFGENYVAYLNGETWRCVGHDFPSLEAAKAAAQADYERRIRSALVAAPAAEPVASPRCPMHGSPDNLPAECPSCGRAIHTGCGLYDSADGVSDPELVLDGIADELLNWGYTDMANREGIRTFMSELATLRGDDYIAELIGRAHEAAVKASAKYPQPNYVTLKIAEEAGEVVRGAVHYAEGRMNWYEVEDEIVQLLAMLIRFVTEGDQVNGVIPPHLAAPELGR
ncbi:hypothetical protein GGR16_002357 [Chelatococcus caeni]|uniref:Uncharacterized protein n=1 Tax=Chelatococcus caeni TaxID=1348468 RepID=A0A840C113_9HYPH|nr:hypothetical protein [Chelatococcus caeni]MBB4017328.1 hypothetical protein [Chelatococcus caeni]